MHAIPATEIGLYIGRYLRSVDNPNNAQARMDLRAQEALLITQFGYDAYLGALAACKPAWEALHDC